MAMLHRALFTWFLMLIFFILLALRLDQRIEWNWFFVFIPVWLYDAIILIYISIHIVNVCRTAGAHGTRAANQGLKAVARQLWHLIAVSLKLVFLALLCYKLQTHNAELSWYFVFSPAFLLLTCLIADVFYCLIQQYRED